MKKLIGLSCVILLLVALASAKPFSKDTMLVEPQNSASQVNIDTEIDLQSIDDTKTMDIDVES